MNNKYSKPAYNIYRHKYFQKTYLTNQVLQFNYEAIKRKNNKFYSALSDIESNSFITIAP
ncbi:hypothetical protein GCM10022289_25500 [Pedobacter jeongneungensis]|uniref:Uncharacterized protein n=1 Tax=Pedobacter jeongneungensis TaxID=947309 RepID=A0ABP8BFL6_9SPHI